jgi:hypothetical protein
VNKKSSLSLNGYIYDRLYNTRSAKPKLRPKALSPRPEIEMEGKKHHYMHAMHHALCDPAFVSSS